MPPMTRGLIVAEAPRVLNKKTSSEDGVYIGRPSKFGNPFVLGQDGTRAEVIQRYKEYLLANPALLQAVKAELAGKNLICWCAPLACHGDVLLEIANGFD
jgi:hypothetical protein